ncbi:regulation of protein autoubiquitination [Homalodisca vitripennis]|nr:regulation of protein autoubiquitination [Homalodisca vitripennis]
MQSTLEKITFSVITAKRVQKIHIRNNESGTLTLKSMSCYLNKIEQEGIGWDVKEGQRGYLEGLASRYADLYNTHYRDVLDHLDELRRREWAELSPRIRILGTPTTPPGPAPSTPLTRVPLTTSHSQPIYVPGKYSPSSCLTDKEEDEIYGFAGYGVYGKQMLQRQQQQAKLVITPRQNYQNCLSPRSAYFYEFPPNERTGKKRTSFSRFLRHLTTHRKEKSSSPRLPASRGGTPDNLDTPPTLLPPMDYDRLRYLQKAQSSSNTFEETIHRLKVQEALKKKERFDREHEEQLYWRRCKLFAFFRMVRDEELLSAINIPVLILQAMPTVCVFPPCWRRRVTECDSNIPILPLHALSRDLIRAILHFEHGYI